MLQYVHTTEDRASKITARLTTSTIVARNPKSEKAESVLNRKGEGPPNATGTLSARRRAARKMIHVASWGRTAETPVNVLRNPSSFSGMRAGSDRPASRSLVLMYLGS